jgi:hypothetical protein
VLIVTNGASAVHVLERAGIPGEKLSWDDVLHDGPVPAGLDLATLSTVRARFIADCGWGAFDDARERFRRRDARLQQAHDDDEVVLWFEHDLYDQLQVLQLLDWFGPPLRRPTRLSLICHARFISLSTDDELCRDFDGRVSVTDAQLALGTDAWAAVRAPTPESVIDIVNGETDALPFVRGALVRFLEELPGRDGLARAERQLLAVVADGWTLLPDAFRRAQEFEDPRYLGDASFARYAQHLAQGAAPLLRRDGDRLALTEVGRAVLEDREDRIRCNGLHRWWGGVRLAGESLWRWDADRQALRPPRRQAE